MGIKNLNRFLKENCTKNAIRRIKLHQIKNKVVVIDASIYMYKYMAENALIENIYLLVSILLANDIIPFFIFDGKPPPEKYDLICKRRDEKKIAEIKHNELLITYNNNIEIMNQNDKNKMIQELNELKNKFVRVTQNDKNRVKQLLTAYGIMYYESLNEADSICAYMVKSGKAWACLSDDMDMFVYGCNRVLRNISLLNKTVILYETSNILKELCMTEEHFKQIMVLSGTDYNIYDKNCLDDTIRWYTKYKSFLETDNITSTTTFYQWLLDNTNYISNIDTLNKICDLFNINHIQTLPIEFTDISVCKGNQNELHTILSQEGFVFT